MTAKKLIGAKCNQKGDSSCLRHVFNVDLLSLTGPLVKMTVDLHSVPVELLQREIKKIAALINRSASLDELDRAWATLCRLREALALATIKARSLAD
jgi:hypothetical protein